MAYYCKEKILIATDSDSGFTLCLMGIGISFQFFSKSTYTFLKLLLKLNMKSSIHLFSDTHQKMSPIWEWVDSVVILLQKSYELKVLTATVFSDSYFLRNIYIYNTYMIYNTYIYYFIWLFRERKESPFYIEDILRPRNAKTNRRYVLQNDALMVKFTWKCKRQGWVKGIM